MRFDRVGAYADNCGIEFPEFLEIVPEGANLFGTAQGIVLGVEEEDHGLTKEVAQPHRLSRLRGERKSGARAPTRTLSSIRKPPTPKCRRRLLAKPIVWAIPTGVRESIEVPLKGPKG